MNLLPLRSAMHGQAAPLPAQELNAWRIGYCSTAEAGMPATQYPWARLLHAQDVLHDDGIFDDLLCARFCSLGLPAKQ